MGEIEFFEKNLTYEEIRISNTRLNTVIHVFVGPMSVLLIEIKCKKSGVRLNFFLPVSKN